jgi:hypothetical protein
MSKKLLLAILPIVITFGTCLYREGASMSSDYNTHKIQNASDTADTRRALQDMAQRLERIERKVDVVVERGVGK